MASLPPPSMQHTSRRLFFPLLLMGPVSSRAVKTKRCIKYRASCPCPCPARIGESRGSAPRGQSCRSSRDSVVSAHGPARRSLAVPCCAGRSHPFRLSTSSAGQENDAVAALRRPRDAAFVHVSLPRQGVGRGEGAGELVRPLGPGSAGCRDAGVCGSVGSLRGLELSMCGHLRGDILPTR